MQFHSAKAVVQAYKAGHIASNANKAVNLETLMELVRMNGFNVTTEWVISVLNEEAPKIDIVDGWDAGWTGVSFKPDAVQDMVDEIEELWGRAIECTSDPVDITECEAIMNSFMNVDIFDSIASKVDAFDGSAEVAECYHEAIMAISDHLASIRGFAYGE